MPSGRSTKIFRGFRGCILQVRKTKLCSASVLPLWGARVMLISSSLWRLSARYSLSIGANSGNTNVASSANVDNCHRMLLNCYWRETSSWKLPIGKAITQFTLNLMWRFPTNQFYSSLWSRLRKMCSGDAKPSTSDNQMPIQPNKVGLTNATRRHAVQHNSIILCQITIDDSSVPPLIFIVN